LGPFLACFHVQIGLEMTPQITLFGPFWHYWHSGLRGPLGQSKQGINDPFCGGLQDPDLGHLGVIWGSQMTPFGGPGTLFGGVLGPSGGCPGRVSWEGPSTGGCPGGCPWEGSFGGCPGRVLWTVSLGGVLWTVSLGGVPGRVSWEGPLDSVLGRCPWEGVLGGVHLGTLFGPFLVTFGTPFWDPWAQIG